MLEEKARRRFNRAREAVMVPVECECVPTGELSHHSVLTQPQRAYIRYVVEPLPAHPWPPTVGVSALATVVASALKALASVPVWGEEDKHFLVDLSVHPSRMWEPCPSALDRPLLLLEEADWVRTAAYRATHLWPHTTLLCRLAVAQVKLNEKFQCRWTNRYLSVLCYLRIRHG